MGSKMVMEIENNEITRMPKDKEIKAICKLFPLKSPCPDGFPDIFFRRYWLTVNEKLIRFVKEVFRFVVIPKTFNKTFLVLILKVG